MSSYNVIMYNDTSRLQCHTGSLQCHALLTVCTMQRKDWFKHVGSPRIAKDSRNGGIRMRTTRVSLIYLVASYTKKRTHYNIFMIPTFVQKKYENPRFPDIFRISRPTQSSRLSMTNPVLPR